MSLTIGLLSLGLKLSDGAPSGSKLSTSKLHTNRANTHTRNEHTRKKSTEHTKLATGPDDSRRTLKKKESESGLTKPPTPSRGRG